MKKRILVVSQHYWPENFRITDICAGFLSHDIEVDVLCGLPNYPKGDWFDGYGYCSPRRQTHNGTEIFRAGEIRRKGNTSIRIFLNYISFPIFSLFHLPRLIGRHYDAVFCYETSPVLMMLPAIVYAKLHRIPLTTYVLDLWPENLYSVLPIKNKALRAIAGGISHWFYRRSDRLIAMSDGLCETLTRIAPKRQVTTIPQYCEDFYAEDVYDATLQQRFANQFTILFAGNISPAQNLDLLVTCAQKLKQNNRNDIHFVIVGDGMSRNALEQSILSSDTETFFTFEGQRPVTDIPAYHTQADALFAALTPSADLGLTVPAKITSYMAAGKPCLVCVDGEATRIIHEAGCGLTCQAGNADALYQNIITLADMSAKQRAALGASGRAYYNAHFKRAPLLEKLERFILSGT